MIVVFSPTADGVIAALLAPLFMSIGFFLWDTRWTSSGGSAFALNMYKCVTASLGFVIMCFLRGFSKVGLSNMDVFTVNSVGFLFLSSTLGIIIGDLLWLEALRLVGAKHVIIIDSIKPFAAAILGRIFLQETLKPPIWGGMLLTILGVGIISWEEKAKIISQTNERRDDDCEEGSASFSQNGSDSSNNVEVVESAERSANGDANSLYKRNKQFWRGYCYAIANVLADSFGAVLTKQHGVGMTTWTINLLRFGFAGITLLLVSFIMRLRRCFRFRRDHTKTQKNDTDTTFHIDQTCNTTSSATPLPLWYQLPSLHLEGYLQITVGVGLVTFLCPAFEKFALFQITLALSISLTSISPLYGLLLEIPFKGVRPTIWGYLGAFLAIAGVVILSVFGT